MQLNRTVNLFSSWNSLNCKGKNYDHYICWFRVPVFNNSPEFLLGEVAICVNGGPPGRSYWGVGSLVGCNPGNVY